MINALMLVMTRTCRSFLQLAKQIWFLPPAWKPRSEAIAEVNRAEQIRNQKARPACHPSAVPAHVIFGPGNVSGLLHFETSLAAQSGIEVPIIVNVLKP
jgi:hypothetical protein